MSIWFSLRKDGVLFDTNMTHNLTPMWREAGMYDAIYMSAGKQARDVVVDIDIGYQKMKQNPERFKPLSSENGWGTYEQALPWLKELVAALHANPDAVIGVSK